MTGDGADLPAAIGRVVEQHGRGGHAGRDQQRLRHRGVADLLRVGLGAEVYEVDAGERGPPAQAGIRTGQREPRGEESGLLGTLTGGEYG